MTTTVSMEHVQLMLKGSRRLNEMEREFNTTIAIVLGFFAPSEICRLKDRFKGSLCFSTTNMDWELKVITPYDLSLTAKRRSGESHSPIYFFSTKQSGTPGIGMYNIPLFYSELPEVLTILLNKFPEKLSGHFHFLLKIASDS